MGRTNKGDRIVFGYDRREKQKKGMQAKIGDITNLKKFEEETMSGGGKEKV